MSKQVFPDVTIEQGDYGRVHHFAKDGMTLRECYAGQIMAGFAASKRGLPMAQVDGDAAYAVKIADALIAALQTEGESDE